MSNQYNPYGPYSQGPYQPQRPQRQPIDDTAMKALGLGIGSIVLSCFCPLISVVLGIFAIIFGKEAIKSRDTGSKTMGIIGIVCGILAIAFMVLTMILVLVLVALDPNVLRN